MYSCCKIVIASEAKRSHSSRREDCHAPDGARKDKSQVIGHLVESAKGQRNRCSKSCQVVEP